MQYASALVLLGILATSFLGFHFHIGSSRPNGWATAAVLFASGMLVFCTEKIGNSNAVPIYENNKMSNNDPRTLARHPCNEDVEVTIRLDDGYFRRLCRRRCIVTILDRGLALGRQSLRRGMPEMIVSDVRHR